MLSFRRLVFLDWEVLRIRVIYLFFTANPPKTSSSSSNFLRMIASPASICGGRRLPSSFSFLSTPPAFSNASLSRPLPISCAFCFSFRSYSSASLLRSFSSVPNPLSFSSTSSSSSFSSVLSLPSISSLFSFSSSSFFSSSAEFASPKESSQFCSPVALETLGNTSNLTPKELNGWVKDFHYLFVQKRYDVITREAYNILPLVKFLRPTELVMIANHFSRCNFSDRQWWQQFAQYIIPYLQDMDGKDLSLLLNAMAQSNVRHEGLLRFLCEEAVHWAPYNSARSSALILNGLIRLNYPSPEVFHAICERVKSITKELNGIDIGNIANACGRANYVDVQLFREMAERAIEIVDELNEHQIATSAWAFSCMNFRNPRTLDALAAQLRKISEARPISERYLPSIVRAYGRVCHSNSDLIEVLRKDAPHAIHKMIPVDAVSTLTGMARCRMSDLTEVVTDLLDIILQKLNRGEIDGRLASNAAMAASKLQCLTYLEFWEGLSNYFGNRLHELQGEDLANVALAFAKLEGNHAWRNRIFKNIIQVLPGNVTRFSPRALSNTALAFAKIDMYNYEAMTSISDAAIKQVNKFNTWDTTELLRSFAFFNLKDERLFKVFGVHIARNLTKFNSFQIDTIASSYLKLGVEDASLSDLLLAQQAKQTKNEKESHNHNHHYFLTQEVPPQTDSHTQEEGKQEQEELYIHLDEDKFAQLKEKKKRR